MARKIDLVFALQRLTRRLQFKSEHKVKVSLFFHVLYSIIVEMCSRNEEEVEFALEDGHIELVSFQAPYKVNVKITMQEMIHDQDGVLHTKDVTP